jgi:hypothetical protein
MGTSASVPTATAMRRGARRSGPRSMYAALTVLIGACLWLSPASAQSANNAPRVSVVGTARVLSDGAIRLTRNGQYYAAGAAWRSTRVDISKPFAATFRFRITPRSAIGVSGADGLAFVIQNDARQSQALGGRGFGLGYGDGEDALGRGDSGVASSVAVEFDTWQNLTDQFEVADPSENQLSIHSRGRSTNSADEKYSIASTTRIPNFSDGTVHSVVLRYSAPHLSVSVDGRLRLRSNIDISSSIGTRDGSATIGVTGSTGGETQTQTVWSPTFTNTGLQVS